MSLTFFIFLPAVALETAVWKIATETTPIAEYLSSSMKLNIERIFAMIVMVSIFVRFLNCGVTRTSTVTAMPSIWAVIYFI